MMRRLCLLLTLAFLSAFCPAQAQLRWIADASLPGTSYGSLYKMISDDRPLILAVGTVNSESAQSLLSAGALQDLAANYGAGAFAAPWSRRELNVLFVDVRVFNGARASAAGVPAISVGESSALLNEPGWDGLYSILGTRLYLVTPDRLVRPLKARDAAGIYAEMQSWATKLKPGTSPDLRLLDAEMDGTQAKVRVQNFSTASIPSVDLFVVKDGQKIASVHYDKSIAALEDAVIEVPLPHGYNTRLTIIASASGDCNDLNNRWSGLLRESGNTYVAATYSH